MSIDGRYSMEFRCAACDQVSEFDVDATPQCCGQDMERVRLVQHGGEAETERIHLVHLFVTPQVDWQLPGEPDHIVEVWKLKPTRINGEMLGWLGVRQLCVEWRLPIGVKIRGGVSQTIEDAVQSMIVALDGGVMAKKHIKKTSIEVLS